jgi:alpha-L-rhamnosidase
VAGLDDRAGLEQLRVAAPLPQPRRRRAALARERAGAGAGQRLVPRPARLHRRPALYGDERGGFAQLEIGYGDGHRQVVVTDTTWQACPSATTANDLYDGQTVDARRCPSAVEWVGVHALDFDASLLAPSATPPIRRHEALRPERIWTSPSGRTLLDFGANIVGWLRFTVQGEAGDEITLRHAEMLEDGELGTRPLRTARATDRLILSGGRDTFEPTFTTHGFRYAEVTGWSGELNAHDIEAVVVHTDLPRTGHFACSDPLLDQLHANVVRSLRGNAVGLPTDCPQRDERLGWTGDLAVFAPTAVFLYDMSAFLGDWLVDLALEQEHAEGRVPLVVPDCLKYAEMPPDLPTPDSVAIWSDAAVWVPWALWEAYGDDEVLRAQWPSMLAHVDRVAARLSDRDLWETGFQFGDWLDPRAPPDDPFASRADNGVVATACFFRTLTMTAATAGVLRRPDEAARLTGLAARVRTAFATHDVDGDGRILSDCPTADALAIVFGLLDGEPRQQAGDRLAELVVADGHRVGTGFAGTPYVTDALTGTGHLDDAYALLLQTECPSWLYPVTMGASTIWERWDSMLPDGSVNPGEMTSFNHYALGAVVDWMHRTVGGIAPLGPGYRGSSSPRAPEAV